MKYLKDIYGFLGLCLIWYGLFLYAPWISYTVVGGLLFITALAASLRDNA